MVQASEEGAVLERLGDERVDFLLEGEIDADSDGAGLGLRVGQVNAFVGGLVLSILCTVLALAAGWLAYSTPAVREIAR